MKKLKECCGEALHAAKRMLSSPRRVLVWLPVAAFLVLIVALSSQTGDLSAELSGRIANVLFDRFNFLGLNWETVHLLIRRCAHVAIFALEGFLTVAALAASLPSLRRSGLYAAAGCAVLAVFDELHKLFVAGRHCHVLDMLLNMLGVALGVGAAMIVLRLVRRRRNAGRHLPRD